MSLDGKTAIVTGASSGIGAAIARALRAEGARVAGGARRVDRVEADVALELDVTDPASCERFVAAAVEQLGGVDVLVNNAGLALGRDPFDDSTEADEEVVLETNVHGLIRMTRLCLPHLRDGGHIVNMGSVAGMSAYPNGSLYVTSKFAVHGFTRALREDLLGRPIRITNVAPGLVETDFSRVRFRGDEEKASAVYDERRARRPGPARGRRRLRPLCAHAPAERERRRDRRHRARAVLGRPHPPRGVTWRADDPRGIDLLHLRRDRRPRRPHERPLRRGHALPLPARAPDQRRAAAAALVREGRVLLGRLLPAQPGRAGGLPQDALSIARERFVGEGMQDHLVVRNESAEPLALRARARGRRGLRGHHHRQGARLRARQPADAPGRCPPRPASRFDAAANQLVLEERERRRREDAGAASRSRARSTAPAFRFALELAPREQLGAARRRRPVAHGRRSRAARGRAPVRRGARRTSATRSRPGTCACRGCAPRSDDLAHSFSQSVADLAALRMRTDDGIGMLPAAGMPWFMTVFGRDTLITSLQTMLLGPELATASLDALAALQAREDDPSIDAEPGKIVHELRRGRAAETWFRTYYGSVDATPLFLVLLSEVWRWTADAGLVRAAARACARRARLDRRLRRPRRRRLRRVRAADAARAREPVVEGLRRLAALPRRRVRAAADRARRGAGLRLRREAAARGARARGLGGHRRSPTASRRRPRSCGTASTSSSGSTRAAATTRSRSTARSGPSTRSARTSGHLLWSGIVPPERRDASRAG